MPNDIPVVDHLNLVVGNTEATVAFYRLMGLEIPDQSAEWPQDHRSAAQPEGVALEFDGIEFAKSWDRGWPGGSGTIIGFRISSRDSVDAIHAKLAAAGYRSHQPPYDAFWGARYAVVEDPDGRAVGLMSPIDPARRSAPPE